ncbi:hypothetical protein [Ramlibacter sp. AN1133]|uniref:hypothetical protein n=1 Tax=Ramlibacter sp. AN1133 TaxID=3133429 RepID=UPI0030C0CBD2
MQLSMRNQLNKVLERITPQEFHPPRHPQERPGADRPNRGRPLSGRRDRSTCPDIESTMYSARRSLPPCHVRHVDVLRGRGHDEMRGRQARVEAPIFRMRNGEHEIVSTAAGFEG